MHKKLSKKLLYTVTCQVLLTFRSYSVQVLVGILDPFQRLWMLWHPKNLDIPKFWPKIENLDFFMANLVKKGLQVIKNKQDPLAGHFWPQKIAFFH